MEEIVITEVSSTGKTGFGTDSTGKDVRIHISDGPQGTTSLQPGQVVKGWSRDEEYGRFVRNWEFNR